MASPRQKLSRNRHNTLWLINAASLVVAIGSVGHVTKFNLDNVIPELIPSAKAVDYYWLGGTSASAADFKANAAWWSGTQTPLNSTNPANAGTAAGNIAGDNLFFGSNPSATGTTYSSNISWGSSNRTVGSLNFILGAPSYTFTANSTRKEDLGSSTQTQPAIYNASSSAITFSSIIGPQGGSSVSTAVVFNQANALGSLIFAGQNSSSYIINPYAYDWALSVGSTAAQAGTFATSQGRAQALALAGRSTSSPSYLKLSGSGTITVSGSMDDGYRNNRGSSTSSYGTPQAAGHLVITNTATTYITGWNTYTGTTTIGDGTLAGGTVVIGSPYAFGGNRLGDTTAPSVQASATAYYAGTTASGFSATTQAFGVVTVNSGFSVDLNGQTMIGANPMSIKGFGTGTAPATTGVIRNTSTNAASYAGLISLAASSTMSASYGNITLAGGVNTVSSNLTVDGSSNTYITGPITGNSSGGIQKFGTGTLTLSGSNNFAGILTLKTGSVIVTSPDALSSLATLSSSGSTNDTGTLTLTGGLINSGAYQMNALNFGGKLIFTTTGGNSTLTFNAASGNAQTGGAATKILVINSGVTLKIAGSFDLVGSTSTLPARYLQIDGDGNIEFNGELRNNASGAALTTGTKGGLNKNTGSGTLTLNGANTFDAGVIFGAGTINVGSAETAGTSGPLGSTGPLTMLGGTLQYSANNNYDYSSRFDTANTNPQKYNVDTNGRDVTWLSALTSTAGTLTKAGLGTLTLSGANTYAGGTTLAGGALQLDSADAIGSTGAITFTGGALKFTSTNAADYSSRFSTSAGQLYNLDTNGQSVSIATALASSGGSLTKSGNGVLTLAAAATFSGDTTINQGELSVASANNLPSASSVVVKSVATLNLNSNNQSIKGLADAGTVSLGTASLTINDGDSRNFSGDITGGGNLIKSGSGTQTFSSTTSLSYSGSTSINAGVLKVNTTLASPLVNIDSGATLAGKGNIAGSVVVASGGIITAGDSSLADASRGALTLSAITFSGTAVINLANININSASSILNAGAIDGTALITINIDNSTALTDNTIFTILKYASWDVATAFIKGTVTGASARQSTFISNDVANSQIILTTAGDTLKWSGSASLNPVWTTTPLNANWKLSSSGLDADYLPEDTVTFDDSATAFVVTLGETVLSGPITFDNSSSAYAVSSTNVLFGIEGTKGLTKTGSALVDINVPLRISGGIIINNGTLALNNAGNTFTGNISLNNTGNLVIGATGALNTTNSLTFGAGASGKLSLNGNNATLTGLYNNTGNVGTPIVENGSFSTNSTLTLNIGTGITNTFDGLIQNGGTPTLSLTKTGSGTLVLMSDNTFTGQTTVTNGILQLGNGGSTGLVAGDIAIGASGTLNLNRTGKLSTSRVFSGSGALNLNYGELELLGSNTFTGTATIYSGTTLTIGSTGSLSASATIVDNGNFEYANSLAYSLGAISGTGNFIISAGSVSQTGNNSLSGSLTIGTGASYALTSTGSFSSISAITNNGTLSIGAHADYTIAAPISGTGDLVSNIGAGKILYLTQDNSYQGVTTVTTGILNVGNGTSTGSLGTGAVTIATGAELIFSRLGNTTLSNTITGSGTGKLTIGTSGSLIVTTDNQIDITGELKFGATIGSATHSTLDLTDGSINVGSLRVQTDLGNTGATSPTNNIIIGTGKSLNVSGLVNIGFDNGSNTTTNLTMSGNGALNIGTLASPTNLNANVGVSLTTDRINYVNWDMSALAEMNMYLGTGIFKIGADNNVNGAAGGSGNGVTVILPVNTEIVAGTILMDALDSGSKLFKLSLGSGISTLNVDTITVGGNSARSSNTINFNSGTGILIVKAKDGQSRATLNVQNSNNSTSNTQIGIFDVRGHSADLYLSTVTIGKRDNTGVITTGKAAGAGSLLFDTGTFDATTLNIANRVFNGSASESLVGNTESIAGNIVGLASFGGGTVNIGTVDLARHGATNLGGTVQGLIEFFGSNTSTLGAVTMATAASSVSGAPDAKGIINITAGTVSIASINGASAALGATATANLNLSGGTLTMGGNITRTGGSGTSAFNLNLSGGTLDMDGNTIGATGSNVTFNWTKGTLKNVSGLNGIDGITVITGNPSTPVYLDGTNTFTSTITIKDSILQLQSSTALGVNSKIGFDELAGILKLGSDVTLDVSSNLSSGNAQLDTNGNNVTFNNSVTGLTSFTKLGSGKLTLSSTSSTLAPTVNIFNGKLEIGNGNNAVPLGGFLYGTTELNLDGSQGSPELSVNGVKVDLDAVVNLLNGGATISGSKGTSSYSLNFKKDIISPGDSFITATDMITGSNSHINVGSGATLTISGSFIDNTDTKLATQINKTGTGTLKFTGTGNTYSGATTVNAGELNIAQGAFTGSSTAITVNNGANLTAVDLGTNVSLNVATGGAADLSGTNLEINALDGAGSVVLSGSTPTLAVSSGTFAGNLSSTETASLVKTGPGTLTISGTNALTGSVTLNGGILSVSDFTALSAATNAPENLIFQGGKLEYTGTAPATMTRGFTVGNGGAGFISSGSDALTISGDMDFADASASNRTLSLGGTSEIAVENIYNPNKIDASDVTNLFTKLEKQNTNKWIVLGAGEGFVDHAQTEIDIQNGELGFAMDALGSNSTITLGGLGGATATLGWANGNTEDVSGRITLQDSARAAFDIPSNNTVNFLSGINGGVGTSLTKTGGGTLELRESSSFTGGFTISGGTVKAFKAGSVGTSSVTVGTDSINSTSILEVNANLLNPITVKSDGTLTTNNAIQSVDDITVASGGTLVPGGDAIGTMTVRSLTLKGGSIVNWQISDASLSAGIGYDTFILNTLLLTDASISNRVHIKVKSISNQSDENFGKSITQSFQFAKFNSPNKLNPSYSNVTSLFEIDASEFEYINGLPTDQLVWYMTVSADREYLYITAMPIPEPSTYGLGLGALALAFAAVRRRKQKKNPAAV